MIRKHFFLLFAAVALVAMIVVGGFKLLGGEEEAAGGPGAGGPAAAAGGAGRGPAGPGGAGGGRAGGGRGGGAVVTAATAQPHTFTDAIQVLGVAKARRSVTITSNTSELVTAVRFRDGQNVTTGQVLVDLKAEQEDAAIAQARAQVTLARQNAERYAILAQRGFAATALADQYRVAYETAQASLENVEAQKLDRVIRAPFSGRVGLSDVAPGTLISAGAPIVSLDDLAVIKVDFDVPDRYLGVIRRGVALTASPDALPQIRVSGRIAEVDTRIDERTRTVKARAEFSNPGLQLKPGMLMRVAVSNGVRQGLGVPESALQFEDQQAIVYVIAEGERGTVAERRPVRIGVNDRGMVEILEGLAAGERVVADGVDKVTAGGPVRAGGAPGAGRGGAGAPAGARGGAPSAAPAAGPAGAGRQGGRNGGGERAGAPA